MLVYKYGGASFLIPYAVCLIGIGMPLLLLELTLGRHFQGGDARVFGGINFRFKGIGWASVYGSFVIATYYCAIISWALYYTCESLIPDLPWACDDATCKTVSNSSRATDHLFQEVLERSSDIMTQRTANGKLVLASFFVWLSVFLSIFKGVKAVSKVVLCTVPLPVVLLVILFFNGIVQDP